MVDDLLFSNRFARWCAAHKHYDHEQVEALRGEALRVLIESINSGEISSLDGVDTPLSKKIKAHHQLVDFEMNTNWIGSSKDWVCPCCSRSKFQISRVGKAGQILAKLVVHHDHMGDALAAAFNAAFEKAGTAVEQNEGKRLVERIGDAFAAHEHVLVCEDCNNADTEAKRRVNAPPFFSFTLGQIRRFIQTGDHQSHRVDALMAGRVWEEAKPAYVLRMKLIESVAHAAATDSHWFEPYPRGLHPVPTLGNGHRIGDSWILQWVSSEALYKALGPQKAKGPRNLSRWRTVTQKAGRSLPANFLAMLLSGENSAKSWDAVPEDWQCPTCGRNKRDAAYVGDNGQVCFYVSSNHGRGPWAAATKICNYCKSVLMSLKLEVSDLIGTSPRDSYSIVSPDELASLIVARPHSPHSIRHSEAAALVETIAQRLA